MSTRLINSMFILQAVIDFFQMDRRVPLGDVTNTSHHHSGGVLKRQRSDLGPTLLGEGENGCRWRPWYFSVFVLNCLWVIDLIILFTLWCFANGGIDDQRGYKRQKARERYASMPTEKKTELNAKKGKTIIVEKPKDNQPMQLCKHLVLLCAMHCSSVFFPTV